MAPENRSVGGLNSADWERVQDVVRTFRIALNRGERPRLEAFLPEKSANSAALLVELIHEEMQYQIDLGEPWRLEPYLDRFAELAADPRTIDELTDAEADLRRRRATADVNSLSHSVTTVNGVMRTPVRLGRYELNQVIGRGSFGIVYGAWDTELKRCVAVKRPRPGALDVPGSVERFLREARSAATLRHPAIIPVFDSGMVDGEPYLVSALIDGRNLADLIADQRPNFRQSAQWAAALAEALEHAHRRGVIHRDVKPSNVLVDREGCVYLTDFGLAKSHAVTATLTVEGQMIGTPAYMAPEQTARANALIDARSDIYSLGVILYELLTGSRPFIGADPMVLARIQFEDPHSPRDLDSTIPPDLEAVCQKAMAKEPGRRYQNATDFSADLKRYLQAEPVLARRERPIGRLARKCRRRPLLSGLFASLMITVVLGLAGVTWGWRRSEFHRRRAESNLVQAEERRQSAVRALIAGDQALIRIAELTHDRILGDAAGESDRFGALLLEQQRRTINTLRHEKAFLAELARASRFIASTLDDFCASELWHPAWLDTLALFEELIESDPANTPYRIELGECHIQLGRRLRQQGQAPEGEDHRQRGLRILYAAHAIQKNRLEMEPTNRVVRRDFSLCELMLGRMELGIGLGPRSEAISRVRNALDVGRVVLAVDPSDRDLSMQVGVTLSESAWLLRDDQPEDALELARSAVKRFDALLAADPLNPQYLEQLTKAADRVAVIEDHLDRSAEALRDFGRAAELYQRQLRDRPFNVSLRGQLGTVFHQMGRIQFEIGHAAEAIEPFRKAIEFREALLKLTPTDIERETACAGSWYRLSEVLLSVGSIQETLHAYRQCVTHQRVVRSREPGEVKHRLFLDARLRDLFRLLAVDGQMESALEISRERLALWTEDPRETLAIAVDLALASIQPRSVQSAVAILGDFDRKRLRYVTEAVAVVRQAVRRLPNES